MCAYYPLHKHTLYYPHSWQRALTATLSCVYLFRGGASLHAERYTTSDFTPWSLREAHRTLSRKRLLAGLSVRGFRLSAACLLVHLTRFAVRSPGTQVLGATWCRLAVYDASAPVFTNNSMLP